MFYFEIIWELFIWKVLKDIQKSLWITALQIRDTGFEFTKLGRKNAYKLTIFDWQNVGGWKVQELQWVVQNLSF